MFLKSSFVVFHLSVLFCSSSIYECNLSYVNGNWYFLLPILPTRNIITSISFIFMPSTLFINTSNLYTDIAYINIRVLRPLHSYSRILLPPLSCFRLLSFSYLLLLLGATSFSFFFLHIACYRPSVSFFFLPFSIFFFLDGVKILKSNHLALVSFFSYLFFISVFSSH